MHDDAVGIYAQGLPFRFIKSLVRNDGAFSFLPCSYLVSEHFQNTSALNKAPIIGALLFVLLAHSCATEA